MDKAIVLIICGQVLVCYIWYSFGFNRGEISGTEEAYKRSRKIIDSYKKSCDTSLQRSFAEHFKETENQRVN